MQAIIKTILLLGGLTAAFSACESAGSDGSLSPVGVGGSMARFTISGNYLYAVGKYSLRVFSTGQETFELINEVNIASGLETIFAQGEYLYLGSTDAVFIYSIAEPTNPSFVFQYSHITACDPVVVQGNRAYVTMRTGGRCNRGTSVLEILDITNRESPVLIASYAMQSPHGLGVNGHLLFLCDGDAGLKVYDTSIERALEIVYSTHDHPAYDVIVLDGMIQVTGEKGIFQYSYNATGQLQLLGAIPVEQDNV